MNRQKVTKSVEDLKTSVDEIYTELRQDSPRKIYLEERIKHLRGQVSELEKLAEIGGQNGRS